MDASGDGTGGSGGRGAAGAGGGGSAADAATDGGIITGTNCLDLQKCVNDCASDISCVSSCQAAASAGARDTYEKLHMCLASSCDPDCTGAGTNCMACLCKAQCAAGGACRTLNEECAKASPDPDCKTACMM